MVNGEWLSPRRQFRALPQLTEQIGNRCGHQSVLAPSPTIEGEKMKMQTATFVEVARAHAVASLHMSGLADPLHGRIGDSRCWWLTDEPCDISRIRHASHISRISRTGRISHISRISHVSISISISRITVSAKDNNKYKAEMKGKKKKGKTPQ